MTSLTVYQQQMNTSPDLNFITVKAWDFIISLTQGRTVLTLIVFGSVLNLNAVSEDAW